MAVAALAAAAIFNKGVVKLVPQPVSLGRKNGEDLAAIQLRIDQSPHQLLSEGGEGEIRDAELVFVGVEVDEGLAVPALGLAGRAGSC